MRWIHRQRLPVENRIVRTAAICIALLGCLGLCGCGGSLKPAASPCPGKNTVSQALAVMTAGPQTISFRASASCIIEFTDVDGSRHKETFDAKMILAEPNRLTMAGDKFGPIQIGVNGRQFWMYVKPGLDTGWWGDNLDAAGCGEKLGFNPMILLEAMGRQDTSGDWQLDNHNGLTVLTRSSLDRSGSKKILINNCTGLAERLEYTDRYGRLVVSADMGNYQQLDNQRRIPQHIELRHFKDGKIDAFLSLRLDNIKEFMPTEIQIQRMDSRPPSAGLKRVYRLNELCNFVPDTTAAER